MFRPCGERRRRRMSQVFEAVKIQIPHTPRWVRVYSDLSHADCDPKEDEFAFAIE